MPKYNINIVGLAIDLEIPFCLENAPLIREIVNKNYNDAFSTDGVPTDLTKQILQELDKPLKSIPANQLDPEHTKSLSAQQRPGCR